MGKVPTNIVLIVQARMGSTRLPGKHLLTVLGRPLLSYLIERLKRVKKAHHIVVATTVNQKDDVLANYCEKEGIDFFRGSENDVLDRFVKTSQKFSADIIVRICADCPLIDPKVIDQTIEFYLSHPEYDFVSNVIDRSFPRGMDVEVFSASLLRAISQKSLDSDEREHVTPYFYRHPEIFKLGSVKFVSDASFHRWTVDTADDLALVSLFIEELYPLNPHFDLNDLLTCANRHPDWKEINRHVHQKEIDEVARPKLHLECLRPLESHARLCFKWRNDSETLKMSFHNQQEPWNSFYRKFLDNYFVFSDLPPLFVVEDGMPVAFLRLEPTENPKNQSRSCCKISINVDPEKRGEGLGRQSLLLAKEFLRLRGFNDAYAEVKTCNTRSKKTFESAGFKSIGDDVMTVFDTGEKVLIHRFLADLLIKNSYAKNSVFIIAEAGSNWFTGKGQNNSFEMAERLIYAAAESGANAVKFQVFRPETIYVPNAGTSHYLAASGIDENIFELFKDLTMPVQMIPQLAGLAKDAGIEFMATPFSPADFAIVDPYVSRHKIASYEIGHVQLLELAARSLKPLILSTGAANENEISWAVETFKKEGGVDLTLLQCTAKYPATRESMNLRAISWLKKRYRVLVGLSDHSLSPLAAPLAAVALGGVVIEKHFTLDKTFEGPDHAFALVPGEFKQMVEAIRQVEPMLGSAMKSIHESECELRNFARRGIQAIKEIKVGEPLRLDQNIAILRPGNQLLGLHSLFLPQIEGKAAKRDIPLGSGILMGDF